MKSKFFFTSESVTEGHPDKICDQISDAILDAFLEKDPNSRVACEVVITTGVVFVTGEISSSANINIESIVRHTLNKIGYNRAKYGFDSETCSVLTSIHEQSPDIAIGVNQSLESKLGGYSDCFDTGAGDQGMMFGFACNETEEYMPLAISLAHKLTKRLTDIRKAGILPYLRPDGKSQVTVEYLDDKPVHIDTIVISAQHGPHITHEKITNDIYNEVILPVIPQELLDEKTKIYINPTGRFVIGGPMGDSGLTGRKIIVDTYGGYAAHGGGAFSGKDPTKVDRSACYAARYIAKNIVASGIATKCQVQLAYAIGVAQPVSINVNTFGTGKIPDTDICDIVEKNFDLRPKAIIEYFDLRKPIYQQTAAYGHFGRNEFPWEAVNRTDLFKI